ncbi:hypothetical protein [Falsiroseomonas sp. HW251]|uniref:hypothetical protein n=1 Tax=Falsiroseomonas sp. HW251 TaxID=3390998 RepID=UPI003D3134CE
MAQEGMKIGIDDIVEQATHGVLRAMDARKVSAGGINFRDLVAAGYTVDFNIRVGGRVGPIDIQQLGGLRERAG